MKIWQSAYAGRSISSDKLAWMLWLLFIAFVTTKKGLDPVDYSNVFLIYRDGALLWLKAAPLYDDSGHGFIYLPQSAALFTPFAMLPESVGSVLWRPINIGVFAVGAYGISSLASHRYRESVFLPVTILSVLMGASAAKLGQMNLIITGLMMLALVDATKNNWWLTACLLVLAFALKPLSIVLILLLGVLYPRTIIPFITLLALLMLIPLLLHDPRYVWEQYQASVVMLSKASTVGEQYVNPFAQVFWMMRDFGVTTPETIQLLIRICFALLTLGACWWIQHRSTPHTFAIYLYTLSVCYLLLFNPRTENNTYAMLAPALGVFAAWSFQSAGRAYGYSYLAIIFLYLFSNRIEKWLIGEPTMWLKPLLCIVFLLLVCSQLRQDLVTGRLALRLADGRRQGKES